MDNATTAAATPDMTLSMMAHIAGRGDVHSAAGEWVGEPGSGLHLEGVAVSWPDGAGTETPGLDYQLAFSGDLRTPWTPSPHFCGSKGLSLACQGLRLRLSADAASIFDCLYDVSFTDGTGKTGVIGPNWALAPAGAHIEAVRLSLRPRAASDAVLLLEDPDAAAMPPPPGGESPWDDPTIRLRLLSPAFASAPPAIRNPEVIPWGSRHAMGLSWDRPGFAERTVSLRVLESVYAVHEGLVLDRDLSPIPCTRRLYSDEEVEWARGRVRALREQGALRRIGGTSLLCKSRAHTNYGHYLVEMFPKAWVGRTLFGHHGLSYIVPQNDILLVVAQSLIGIGISPGALAWTDNEPVLCDRLLLLDGLTFHGQYQSALCARALQALAADVPADPPAKLFISRRARDRPLLNEDRVAQVLRERGFRVIDPGQMSFREQIAVFKGAQIVVGGLGAALTNIAFCASGTPVVALTSASFPDTFFWFLAQHRRLDYREIRGTDIAAPGQQAPWNEGFTLTEADIAYLATL